MMIEEKLKNEQFKALCVKYNVRLVMLFGSRAKGQFKPSSDWDLAFWFDEKALKKSMLDLGRLKKNLVKELCAILQTSEIDLVILNRTSPFLKYKVAQTGRPIYMQNKDDYAVFVSRAIRSLSDGFIFKEAGKKYLKERA